MLHFTLYFCERSVHLHATCIRRVHVYLYRYQNSCHTLRSPTASSNSRRPAAVQLAGIVPLPLPVEQGPAARRHQVPSPGDCRRQGPSAKRSNRRRRSRGLIRRHSESTAGQAALPHQCPSLHALCKSTGGDWKRETWHRETGQRGTRLNRSQRVEHPSAQEKKWTCWTISERIKSCLSRFYSGAYSRL